MALDLAQFKKWTRTLSPGLGNFVPFSLAGTHLAMSCLAPIGGLVCCVVRVLVNLCPKRCPLIALCTMGSYLQNLIFLTGDVIHVFNPLPSVRQAVAAFIYTSWLNIIKIKGGTIAHCILLKKARSIGQSHVRCLGGMVTNGAHDRHKKRWPLTVPPRQHYCTTKGDNFKRF